MVRTLLVRGMMAGAIVAIFAFGFARTFGEPQVDRAIAFEEAHSDGASHSHGEASEAHQHAAAAPAAEEEPELVSRSTQAGIGLLTASIIYGIGIGGLFALVFAFVQDRVVSFGPRGTAALLALAAFLAVALVPALKFPPNPPAVGHPETIGYRTAAYFLMVLVSVGAMCFAVSLGRRMAPRLGAWNGGFAGAIAFIAIVAVAQAMLPGINEVPDDFPAVVLWNFRVTSLGLQLILWGGIGLVFGAFAERAMAPTRRVA
ncbi:MAG TPA: CbtA family protein [Parvibaculum sp.]